MRSKFRIVKRQRPDGSRRFIVRYIDNAGKVSHSETIHEARTVTQAAALAQERVRKGISAENPEALSFVLQFWTEDSEYCQKKARGRKPLSKAYLYNNRRLVNNHFAPVLKGRLILDLTPSIIEAQMMRLSKKGIGPRTINQGLQAITVPIRWFCRMHRIAYSLEWLEKESEFPKERGVLSMPELERIIASGGKIGSEPRMEGQVHGPGKSDIAPNQYAAILLGALCGLRAGEIRGLLFDDVDSDAGVIHIVHNWVDSEGLKKPKQGSTRTVPAVEPVLKAIEVCRAMTQGPFVFYNIGRIDIPGRMKTLSVGFEKVLRTLGISKEEKEKRALVFHGLRHFFVSFARSSGFPDYVVQRLSGHKSTKMLENYSHVEKVIDFEATRTKMAETIRAASAASE